MGLKKRPSAPVNELLAARVRDILGDLGCRFGERRMFGGIAYMVRGHMTIGILGDELMARVGPDDYEAALARPHARLMDFTGRPLRGYVYVAAEAFGTDAGLRAWVTRCVEFTATLPAR